MKHALLMSQHESLSVSLSYTTCLFTLLTCKYLCIIIVVIVIVIVIFPFASIEMSNKDQQLHDVVFSRRHVKICFTSLVNLDRPR